MNRNKQTKDLREYNDKLKNQCYTLEFRCIHLERKNHRLQATIEKVKELIEQYSKNDYYFKYDNKYLKSEIIGDLSKILNEGDDKR